MIRTLALALALSGLVTTAQAQTFPSRGVTIVSPYQAGGTSDIIARVLAQKLSERFGQNVVVENRPGANGGLGVNQVVRAEPDGHTLLAVASSALTLNPIFYKSLSYDVGRDLAPIARTGQVTNVLVVNPSVPAKDLKELVALAKEKPGELLFASQGVGSNGHLIAEQFRLRAGIDYRHVPYKGSSPAVQDLLGGRVQMMFDNLPSVLPQIQSGNLRALAVTTAERSSLLPDVPTIAEMGYPGFDAPAWFAVLTAKSVPANIRADLEKAVIESLKSPDVRDKLKAAGVEVAADGADDLGKRIARETEGWRDVVSKARIEIQ
ncbi:tripartite tricarboxylate transporter substrate binding protein [Pseudorhodoplanes sp.]|uniref:Bug family tripartite tricarboxylate transporter substrate binding protein n=1 Tax=Pseudorhodoplanes sp. TaxID=1934341 RepID=UPI002C109B80|nr:tripartite tricarboxylate transporter substrate binding protein [Pseudorhodoplanes sp.]HWV55691.1 tripartite tricarboxylate transporter substrate binding protein [Pseudorhodoplanes sp.]